MATRRERVISPARLDLTRFLNMLKQPMVKRRIRVASGGSPNQVVQLGDIGLSENALFFRTFSCSRIVQGDHGFEIFICGSPSGR